MSLSSHLSSLISYTLRVSLLNPIDEIVLHNSLLDLFHLPSWSPSPTTDDLPLPAILSALCDDAVTLNLIPDTAASRDAFSTRIMGLFTPLPHTVAAAFDKHYALSPLSATDWYFSLEEHLGYIRTDRLARNIRWQYAGKYGTLEITINRSKPEKDPRDIAAAAHAASSPYPKCALCLENEGFAGIIGQSEARQNLRPVPVSVGEEHWYLQYSPYGYYDRHCILFSEHHSPMVIDRGTFQKLFDAVDRFPHWFFGSNADLPIVGGSILSHEHFQGGQHVFPMERAPLWKNVCLENFPSVRGGAVQWPMSVLRLVSENREELTQACAAILALWRGYSDEDAGIFAQTEGEAHNTITPIARKVGDIYICSLVFRNNFTTPERPLGVYHPHPKLHHIKKENIGLIEVMGLAILPGRLAEEMRALQDIMVSSPERLCDPDALSPAIAPHADWAREILSRRGDFRSDTAREILREEIGIVFEKVLEDAGVFKQDEPGREAFGRFLALAEKV